MKRLMMTFSAALACATLVFPTLSHAARFGDVGTLAPSGVVTFDRTSISPPGDGDSTTITTLGLMPQLQYFVADNLAVGAGLSLLHISSNDGDNTTTGYGIAPSIAYNIALADNVSLFPTAMLSYSAGKTKATVAGTETESSSNALSFGMSAPVLFHFNNFFIGAGPFFETQLSSKAKLNGGDSKDASKTTSMGLTSVVGGWF